VKNNMPFGTSQSTQQLSNEEAWDVAAFINSQPRSYKNIDSDWPDLATKPYDHPFGPYTDSIFDQAQHKYGPYAPIKSHYSSLAKRK
jgi:thiosulfate dehydrogenase